MNKGIKALLVTLAVTAIVALSAGSIAMAAGNDTADSDTADQIRDRARDCDETCLQQNLQLRECDQAAVCLKEQQQQRICQQNETCTQTAEQSRTRLNWQDDTCPGNSSGQQGDNQSKGKRSG